MKQNCLAAIILIVFTLGLVAAFMKGCEKQAYYNCVEMQEVTGGC